MGQDQPPTIPSQLMDYSTPQVGASAAGDRPPVWKLLLRMALVVVACLVVYRLVRR